MRVWVCVMSNLISFVILFGRTSHIELKIGREREREEAMCTKASANMHSLQLYSVA